MDKNATPPPPPQTSPAASGVAEAPSSTSPLRTSTASSSVLAVSTTADSQRLPAPSLYPPPLPRPSSRRHGAAPGSSSSRSRPLSPSALFSELMALRMTGAKLFSDLEMLRPTRCGTTHPRFLLHGQLQARPSSSTSGSGLPPLSGRSFSGFPPSPSQQQQHQAPPPLTTHTDLLPLPNGSFSGFFFPQTALQPQQTPWLNLNETTIIQSFSPSPSAGLPPIWGPASSHTFSGTGLAPPSSESERYELAPLPPCLQMPLLPVKHEPIDDAPRREPELISLEDGDELSALPPDQMGIGGSSGCACMPPEPVSNYNLMGVAATSSGCAGGSMAWQCSGSSSMENSMPTPKFMLGGMESPGLSSRGARARSSTSRGKADGDIFSDVELETIMKEKRLRELVDTNPKRVKRILTNRFSAARLSARRVNYVQDLERRIAALQIDKMTLSSQVGLQQARTVELSTQNNELRIRLHGLEEQSKLKEDLHEALRAQIKSLQLAELNPFYANGLQNRMSSQMTDETAGWYANGIHQLMDAQMNGTSGSHIQLQTQEQPSQLQEEEQSQQAGNDPLRGK
ncbi:hypothetical protein ACP70R_049499 [Stipagrostis hirtigluma subsp. patula]